MKESKELNKNTPAYLLFDFETTGFNPPGDKPVQLAHIILDESKSLKEELINFGK